MLKPLPKSLLPREQLPLERLRDILLMRCRQPILFGHYLQLHYVTGYPKIAFDRFLASSEQQSFPNLPAATSCHAIFYVACVCIREMYVCVQYAMEPLLVPPLFVTFIQMVPHVHRITLY